VERGDLVGGGAAALEEDEAATFLDLFFILSFIGHVAVNCDHD
jgi:hypothetical protein